MTSFLAGMAESLPKLELWIENLHEAFPVWWFGLHERMFQQIMVFYNLLSDVT